MRVWFPVVFEFLGKVKPVNDTLPTTLTKKKCRTLGPKQLSKQFVHAIGFHRPNLKPQQQSKACIFYTQSFMPPFQTMFAITFP